MLWQNVKNASVDLCMMSERKGCENEVENEGENESELCWLCELYRGRMRGKDEGKDD